MLQKPYQKKKHRSGAFLKNYHFSISPIFIAIAHPTELFLFFMSFLTTWNGLGLVGPVHPFGLLSDMALETSSKIVTFLTICLWFLCQLLTYRQSLARSFLWLSFRWLVASSLHSLKLWSHHFLTHLIDLFWLVSH